MPFLDVLVEWWPFAFVTSIYRKLTFTGLYLSWHAFVPKSRKVNSIKWLTLGGARGVMVIVIGYGHGDTSSILGQY